MRLVVFDPVVFAAGIFWRHEPRLCLKAWLHGIITPVMTDDILTQYKAVLEQVRQGCHLTPDTGLWLDTLCESAMWVEGKVIGKRLCRDGRDQRFLEAAVAAQCQTIIACNQELRALGKPFGVDIYTPHEWLGTLTRQQRRLLD